jgi:DNA gyrase subunit B
MAKMDGEKYFLYNDHELARLTKEKTRPKAKKTDEEEPEEKLDVLEIYEAEEIEEFLKKLAGAGLDITYYDVQESEKPKKAPFLLQFDKTSLPAYSLKNLLHIILTQGKKGMTIQRYKGLGEMNPEQLWETTMDPERRTILQVKLEDAVAADEMFTVLMGDAVEPRREFIEEHSHEVRNLDI